jgi:hypothetical protein
MYICYMYAPFLSPSLPQASFIFLELIHPVTHAVTNALKRVVIILVAGVVFRTPLSTHAMTGALIAISGTLLYSLMQTKYSSAVTAASASSSSSFGKAVSLGH